MEESYLLLHDLEPRKKKSSLGFKKSTQITTSQKPRNFNADHPANQDYGPDWDRIKREVKERDGWRCQDCGKKALNPKERSKMHAHHILSLSKGGRNIKSNLKCVCSKCHKELYHKNNKYL